VSQLTRPKLIVEWSPGSVLAYQTGTAATRSGATVAAATSGLTTSDVLVALSRRNSFLRTTRVPNASHDDVAIIVEHQLGSLFPISSEGLAFDFFLTDDVTAEGRLALVAAVQADQLRQLNEECRDAGIKVGVVVPAALGSVELMRTMGIRDAAVVQVDDHGASIDVVTGGVLRYSRWTAATRDVPGEVRRTFAAAAIEPVPILATGGSTIPAEYTKSESTLLSLTHIDLAKPPLNIELAEVRESRTNQAKANAIRASALVLVAGLASAIFFGVDRYGEIKDVKDKVAKQQKALAGDKQYEDKVKVKGSSALAEFNTVSRGFAPAQRFWEVLAVITHDVPDGVWLTGISMERGKPFTIRGTALNSDLTAVYSKRLTVEDRFRDVKLQYSNDAAIDNRPVVEFSIVGFPIGNLPLVDAPNSSSKPTTNSSSTDTLTSGAKQ